MKINLKRNLRVCIFSCLLTVIGVSTAFAFHQRVTTCTNSCVIETDSATGITTITDCCGGTVTTVMLAHENEEIDIGV
jgi:hypothetical protein